jgi:hypothetical protein
MITIELYNLDVLTGTFTRKAVINSYSNLSFSEVLNGVGECSFVLNVLNPILTKENFIQYRTQVLIKEGDNPLWVGTYTGYDSELRGEAGSVTIKCLSYFAHLFARNTDKITNYIQVEQAQILRNLLILTQGRTNGGLGITYNSENTGIIRDRTYEYKNIGEALVQMSGVINGCDFEFVPVLGPGNLLESVNLRIYTLRKGEVRNDLNSLRVGELGNVLSFGLGVSDELYNYVVSEGQGSQDVVISVFDNSALQLSYTRRETYYPQKDVLIQSTLDQNTQAYGNTISTPKFLLNCVLNPLNKSLIENLKLGDIINIDIDARDISPNAGDLIQFENQARIVGMQYNIDEQGVKTITPKLLFRS